MKIFEVVHITWVDSEAINEWTPITELNHEFNLIHTIGLLVHLSPEKYIIANSIDPETESINAVMIIPSRCVKSAETLKVIDLGRD